MLKNVLGYYRTERQDGEEFNAFVDRVGVQPFEEIAAKFAEVGQLNKDTIDTYMDWDRTTIYKLERGEGECAV